MRLKPIFLHALAILSLALQAAVPAAQTETITIHGVMADTEGNPVRGFASIHDHRWNFLTWTESDSDGYYRLRVPRSNGYIIQVEPSNRVRSGSAIFASDFLDQSLYVATTGSDLEVNFILQPGGAIWLQTYTPQGQYVFLQDKPTGWNMGVYPLGASPASPSLQYIYHQRPISWGWQDGSSQNHPVALVPADTPVELWIHWPIPEVGNTFIHLDNDGQGYIVPRRGVLPVNVLYEAARTEHRLFQERLAAYQADGYTFTDEIGQWNSEASQALEQAQRECPNGNISACIPASYTVLTRILRAREEAVFQAAQQDIETNRRTDVTVQIVDCSGVPLTGVDVHYQQTSHDFIFAVGWPSTYNQAQILSEAGFNSATQEAWWSEVLSTPDVYDYRERYFAPIVRAGMKIVMHTGIWITPGWMPTFAQRMSAADLEALAHDYSYNITRHYREHLVMYNAFNEPQNAFGFMPLSTQDLVNIAAASVQGAQEGAPHVPTYINFYSMYLGDLFWPINSTNETFPTPNEILQAMLAQDIPFDNIGLEFYNGVFAPTIDIGIFNDALEAYSGYGKTIFVSELSYDATDDATENPAGESNGDLWFRDGWHAGYTDEAQAEWARYTYTVTFSKPYTTGVMWVPCSDPAEEGDLSGAGLFDQNKRPRPIVETVGGLIQSWTTSGAAQTDSSGTLTWRGFAGDYILTWTNPDGTPGSATIHVAQGGENRFTVQAAACAQMTPTETPTMTASTIPTPTASAPETSRAAFPAWAIALAGILLVLGIYLFFRRQKSSR